MPEEDPKPPVDPENTDPDPQADPENNDPEPEPKPKGGGRAPKHKIRVYKIGEPDVSYLVHKETLATWMIDNPGFTPNKKEAAAE